MQQKGGNGMTRKFWVYEGKSGSDLYVIRNEKRDGGSSD